MGLSSITVKWEPIPGGSLNGRLVRYRVRYRHTFSNGSDGEIQTLFRVPSATHATLTELEKAFIYMIEVAGETSAGIGVFSAPVTAKTGKFESELNNQI